MHGGLRDQFIDFLLLCKIADRVTEIVHLLHLFSVGLGGLVGEFGLVLFNKFFCLVRAFARLVELCLHAFALVGCHVLNTALGSQLGLVQWMIGRDRGAVVLCCCESEQHSEQCQSK